MSHNSAEFFAEMHDFFQALTDQNPADSTWMKESKADFSRAARLHVYTYAYRQRLLDAVISDYPATAFFLTPEIFHRYAQQFVSEQPSRHWDLNLYSPAFAEWLKEKAPEKAPEKTAEKDQAAASLAALEAAIVQVYWHPDEATLAADFFSQISEEQLMTGHFIRKTKAIVLTLNHAAEDFIQAFRQEVPQPLLPTPQAVLVCKSQGMVKRLPLDNPEVYFLQSLAEGQTLGESVEQWLKAHPDAEAALLKQLPLYFQRFFTLGIFSDFYH